MLRHYDEIGLLIPDEIDDFTSYRYYCESQLPLAARITSLKDMGFGLTAIAEILENYEDAGTLANFLLVKQTEIREQAKQAEYRIQLLETAIEKLREDDGTMNYNVTLKELPERNVASVRSTIPAYDQEGMLWETLMRETAPMRMQYDEPCYSIALFHDSEYKEADVDVEVQLSVKGSYENTEHVIFKAVPAVQIASATYKGSYAQITEVNEAVANWVRDNGYEFNGNNFCIYYVGPAQTSNPDEYVTEVCYPVIKK